MDAVRSQGTTGVSTGGDLVLGLDQFSGLQRRQRAHEAVALPVRHLVPHCVELYDPRVRVVSCRRSVLSNSGCAPSMGWPVQEHGRWLSLPAAGEVWARVDITCDAFQEATSD